jgi:hypothetical protein
MTNDTTASVASIIAGRSDPPLRGRPSLRLLEPRGAIGAAFRRLHRGAIGPKQDSGFVVGATTPGAKLETSGSSILLHFSFHVRA